MKVQDHLVILKEDWWRVEKGKAEGMGLKVANEPDTLEQKCPYEFHLYGWEVSGNKIKEAMWEIKYLKKILLDPQLENKNRGLKHSTLYAILEYSYHFGSFAGFIDESSNPRDCNKQSYINANA